MPVARQETTGKLVRQALHGARLSPWLTLTAVWRQGFSER
ncbi:hypothetical protein SS05631_c27200 [Sinorhizobium sp. CCBAU 05631]|nr:hypothetical protein SS05631_c27200 [Sinorhizobium sp. CCBAU 05631]